MRYQITEKRGLSWGQALTVAGVILFMLGGMAADSPSPGHLYAAGMVLVGLALAVLGQKVGRR